MDEISGELLAVLQPHLRPQAGPGKGGFSAVTRDGVGAAAARWNVTAREAMRRLLELGVWPLRFARNRGVMTAGEQAALLASGAAVVGCGGLGGYAATLLARLGVGALSLCDYDDFDESNLNRQLLAREDNLGTNKAAAAAAEIRALASHVEVRVFPVRAGADTLPAILRDVDIVVDCLDSVETRLVVEKAGHARGLPFVHASLAGGEGFAMVSRPGGTGLKALYGDGGQGGGAEKTLGVPTPTPAAVAALEVCLAWRELLAKNPPEQELLHVDLTAMNLERILL